VCGQLLNVKLRVLALERDIRETKLLFKVLYEVEKVEETIRWNGADEEAIAFELRVAEGMWIGTKPDRNT
jgi:hypothetical protein